MIQVTAKFICNACSREFDGTSPEVSPLAFITEKGAELDISPGGDEAPAIAQWFADAARGGWLHTGPRDVLPNRDLCPGCARAYLAVPAPRIRCPRCEGDGVHFCLRCDRSGEIATADGPVECPECHGNAVLACAACGRIGIVTDPGASLGS